MDGYDFCLGPIILDECTGDLRLLIEAQIHNGNLQLLDDELLPASLFATILQRFRLGEGETECLAFAHLNGLDVCTDDLAARRAAAELLGVDHLIGSLGLLRVAVGQTHLTAVEALAVYRRIVAEGGFLPVLDDDFFDPK